MDLDELSVEVEEQEAAGLCELSVGTMQQDQPSSGTVRTERVGRAEPSSGPVGVERRNRLGCLEQDEVKSVDAIHQPADQVRRVEVESVDVDADQAVVLYKLSVWDDAKLVERLSRIQLSG